MRTLIDHFNQMLTTLPAEVGLAHVQHVDLRGLLSNELAGNAYRADWDNELHPEDEGFEAVADRFQAVLVGLP